MQLELTCPREHGLVKECARVVERGGEIHARAQAGGGGVLEWDEVIGIRPAVAAAFLVTVDWNEYNVNTCSVCFVLRNVVTYKWRGLGELPDGPQCRWKVRHWRS